MTYGSTSDVLTSLRRWVAAHAPGDRLPSSRSLVAAHHVSAGTVQRAVQTLATEGLLESRPGVGTFVRAQAAARPRDVSWQTAALRSPRTTSPLVAAALRPAPDGAIAMHSGYPDPSLLPVPLVRGAVARGVRGGDAFERAPVAGLPHLRAWFANELAAASGADATPPTANDVVVVPGSQAGLTAVFRSVVPAGRPLLVESPTYWGAMTAAAQAGVRLVPVPSGPTGPDPDDVARAFDETGASAFYAQPFVGNPTGATWSAETARAVLDVVRARDVFLVEDDWAHDFGIDASPRPVAALDDSGHVIYLRSLTKSVSPSVRVAAVVARGPVRQRILADAGAEAMYVSALLQSTALDVVTQPGWAAHRRAVRLQLQTRRDLLVQSLREHAPTTLVDAVPRGGLHLWVRLPDGTDVGRVVHDAESRGLLVTSGDEAFPAEPSGPFVRLGYAGPDPSAFPTAARILHAALLVQER